MVRRWFNQYETTAFDESADPFVNEAFARMWQYGSRPETATTLDGLGKCLVYLKRCLWSAIEDERRRRNKDALAQSFVVNTTHALERLAPTTTDHPETGLILADLQSLLTETILTDDERLVAEAAWMYDLSPRQTQAQQPDRFASAAQVSQIKRNLLKRLKRRMAAEIEAR
jgi:hypothetical protein